VEGEQVNPDIVGCDVRNTITGIRCGLPIAVEHNDVAMCKYCAPDEIDDREVADAVRNFKRAGML
jgi:hypothetical protein